MKITTIGLDLAKMIFHIVCCDKHNAVIRKKTLKRNQVLSYMARLPTCTIAMEACGTAHYWGRQLQGLGHRVKLLPPQQVKAFLTGNKNDYNDAYAIVVASQQRHIRAVSIKTESQQDHQSIHTVRELAIRQRTALGNQIRGLLLEYGVAIGQGRHQLNKRWLELMERSDITDTLKSLLSGLKSQWNALEQTIQKYDEMIQQQVKHNELCQRLQTIPGVGPLSSHAYFNEVGHGGAYSCGRDVSASLGLVPKQHSTGGKSVLLGISKKGNRYLRCLLIQGAKAVVSRAKHKTDTLSRWINRLVQTRGHNRACVAYANKIARIAWAITVSGETYQPNYQTV